MRFGFRIWRFDVAAGPNAERKSCCKFSFSVPVSFGYSSYFKLIRCLCNSIFLCIAWILPITVVNCIIFSRRIPFRQDTVLLFWHFLGVIRTCKFFGKINFKGLLTALGSNSTSNKWNRGSINFKTKGIVTKIVVLTNRLISSAYHKLFLINIGQQVFKVTLQCNYVTVMYPDKWIAP